MVTVFFQDVFNSLSIVSDIASKLVLTMEWVWDNRSVLKVSRIQYEFMKSVLIELKNHNFSKIGIMQT